jgi:hypothetical protein
LPACRLTAPRRASAGTPGRFDAAAEPLAVIIVVTGGQV